jgi:hypothetical protein
MKVFTPASQEIFLMLIHESLYPIDLLPVKAAARLKPHRIEPEFGYMIITLNMNVGRLLTITCVKEKSVRANSAYRWHCKYAFPFPGLRLDFVSQLWPMGHLDIMTSEG